VISEWGIVIREEPVFSGELDTLFVKYYKGGGT
jgi:hypothetical protein